MPIQLLSVGYPQQMLQDVIYALPASRVRLFTSDAAPTIEQSNSSTFADNVAITLADGMADLAGGFIRCTSGNITVTLKRY